MGGVTIGVTIPKEMYEELYIVEEKNNHNCVVCIILCISHVYNVKLKSTYIPFVEVHCHH